MIQNNFSARAVGYGQKVTKVTKGDIRSLFVTFVSFCSKSNREVDSNHILRNWSETTSRFVLEQKIAMDAQGLHKESFASLATCCSNRDVILHHVLSVPVRLPKECGRHPTQVLGPPPEGFQRVERRGITRLTRSRGPPLVTLCPAKNTRQSPTASAVGPRVARGHSPDRGDRNSHGDFCGFETTAARSRHSWESAVPAGT